MSTCKVGGEAGVLPQCKWQEPDGTRSMHRLPFVRIGTHCKLPWAQSMVETGNLMCLRGAPVRAQVLESLWLIRFCSFLAIKGMLH